MKSIIRNISLGGITPNSPRTFKLPKGSAILDIKIKPFEYPVMWYTFNKVNENDLSDRTIHCIGIEVEYDQERFIYLATVQYPPFTFHFFEEI